MNTSPLAETPTEAAAREPVIVKARAGRLDDVLRDVLPPDSLASGPGRAEVLILMQKMGQAQGADVFVRQSRALQRRRDQQGTLRRCKVPALVLCGAHDTIAPVKRHAFMAELIPYCDLKIIEDAGQMPTLEQPDQVTDALRGWMAQPLVLR
jgi:pimeloyl-ACP methyl ester carboxylesterase